MKILTLPVCLLIRVRVQICGKGVWMCWKYLWCVEKIWFKKQTHMKKNPWTEFIEWYGHLSVCLNECLPRGRKVSIPWLGILPHFLGLRWWLRVFQAEEFQTYDNPGQFWEQNNHSSIIDCSNPYKTRAVAKGWGGWARWAKAHPVFWRF